MLVVVLVAVWRLVPPVREYTYQIAGSLTHKVRVPLTVFGDEAGLFVSEEGSVDPAGADHEGSIPFGTKHIWHGGGVHETTDPAIRDLWLNNGFDVEQVG